MLNRSWWCFFTIRSSNKFKPPPSISLCQVFSNLRAIPRSNSPPFHIHSTSKQPKAAKIAQQQQQHLKIFVHCKSCQSLDSFKYKKLIIAKRKKHLKPRIWFFWQKKQNTVATIFFRYIWGSVLFPEMIFFDNFLSLLFFSKKIKNGKMGKRQN